MFRLLGFIIGSLTSIAIILLVTGMPTFHLEDPEIDQKRFDAAVEKLLARKEDAAQVEEQLTQGVAQTKETMPATPELPQGDPVSQPDADLVAADPVANDTEALGAAPRNFAFLPPGDAAPASGNTQWYSFWNPFRSQIAANGFVSQLEKVTGLDYRVVKIKTGVYEVAFAYGDDTERRNKLAQISAATGLDLPGS
jgi:hypothetical protein